MSKIVGKSSRYLRFIENMLKLRQHSLVEITQ